MIEPTHDDVSALAELIELFDGPDVRVQTSARRGAVAASVGCLSSTRKRALERRVPNIWRC